MCIRDSTEHTQPEPARITDMDALTRELSAYVAQMKEATIKA